MAEHKVTEADPFPDGGGQRAERVGRVVREYYRRLAAGESVTEESIIKAHPDLMPELAKELATLRLIERARMQAGPEETDRSASTSARQEGSSDGLQIRCPSCHTPVEMVADTSFTDITCPACGSHFSLIEEETETGAEGTRATIGRFQLLERMGRGGFGTVWKARDTELDRTVAVKIPRKGRLTPSESEQFLREARTAAQLRHPNIVGIHEVGREADTIYIVTDLVRGVPLSDWLASRRASVREAADLCTKIAEALSHAHQMGVIHRDLKPQNIMIDSEGHPRVTDFGLARREAGEVTVTLDGQLLGTPAYMSPEQARGQAHQADCRSDVYSLGVILFELLTGELPFRGNVRMLIHQVIHEEPLSPRRLNGNVPRDLETVCLKCLDKDPRRRYSSAKELADELHRFLRGEPIKARPIHRAARTWRWCKRNPLAAAVIALVVFLGIAGPLVAVRQSVLATNEAEARSRADENLRQSLIRQAGAMRLARESGYRRKVFDLLRQALAIDASARDLDELRQEAVGCMGDFVGLEPTIWQDFSSDISELVLHPTRPQLAIGLADGSVLVRNLAGGGQIACSPRHGSRVVALAFDHAGQRLVSGDDQGNVFIWRAGAGDRWVRTKTLTVHDGPETDQPSAIDALAVTANGDRLFVCHGKAARVTSYGLGSGADEMTVDRLPPADEVAAVAISRDARLLARSQQRAAVWEILVWDVAKGEPVTTFAHDLAQGIDVDFSTDGRHLLYGCGAGVGICDVAANRHRIFLRDDFVASAAMSSDNRILAAPCPFIGLTRLWSVTRDREIGAVQHLSSGWPYHVLFGDDDRLLVAAFDRSVCLWNLAGPEERVAPRGHENGVPNVAFNREGTQLASAGRDRTVRLWDPSLRQIGLLSGFHKEVQTVAFSHDGRLLATGDWSGDIQLWDPRTGRWLALVAKGPDSIPRTNGQDRRVAPLTDPRLGAPVWVVAFSEDGRYFAAARDGVQVWRIVGNGAASGGGAPISLQPVARPTDDRTSSMCFSPNGKWLAWTGSQPSWSPYVWDLQNNRLLGSIPSPVAPGTYAIAFHPDSRRLTLISANSADDRAIETWDVETKTRVSRFSHSSIPVRQVHTAALSRDGRRLAWAMGSTVTVWDMQRGRRLLQLPPERGVVWSMAWSPDGRRLVLGTSAGGPVVWSIPKIRAELGRLGLDW